MNISALKSTENSLVLSDLKTPRQKQREELLRQLEALDAISSPPPEPQTTQEETKKSPTIPYQAATRVLSMGHVPPQFGNIWSAPTQAGDKGFHAMHVSGNFGDIGNRVDAGGRDVFQVQTHQLKMTTVTRATYTSLMAMKDEIDRNIKLNHQVTPKDRSAWIDPVARRTINDTLKRVHAAEKEEGRRRGIVIPDYVEHEYVGWDHTTFFSRVPPYSGMLRTHQWTR